MSEDQLENLLAALEQESPGAVNDEWEKITVKTKGGKTFVFTLYSDKAGSRGQSRST